MIFSFEVPVFFISLQLSTFKLMDALTYLESRCQLRRNVLTGETLYAIPNSDEYLPLSREAINTLILEAGREGVGLSEGLLRRYAESTLIAPWNPAEAWLHSLDEWDGTDHVAALADRIITTNPDWPQRFHKWMLQMVARWIGYEVAQRDVLVPTIVGTVRLWQVVILQHHPSTRFAQILYGPSALALHIRGTSHCHHQPVDLHRRVLPRKHRTRGAVALSFLSKHTGI